MEAMLAVRRIREDSLKSIPLFLALSLVGCFTPADVVLERHPALWSRRDCLTVVASAMRHNFLDPACPNIKVVATPYTASVIKAIERFSQIDNNWSEEEYRRQTDTLLAQSAGIYYDWIGDVLFNSRGNFVHSAGELDSLLFLVTITNRAWPCVVPTKEVVLLRHNQAGQPDLATTVPRVKIPSDWPCYDPDLSDLESRILLVNDRNETTWPEFVWGRRHNHLTPEETVFVRFLLREGGKGFLDGCAKVYLVVEGLEGPIRLEFPVAALK